MSSHKCEKHRVGADKCCDKLLESNSDAVGKVSVLFADFEKN